MSENPLLIVSHLTESHLTVKGNGIGDSSLLSRLHEGFGNRTRYWSALLSAFRVMVRPFGFIMPVYPLLSSELWPYEKYVVRFLVHVLLKLECKSRFWTIGDNMKNSWYCSKVKTFEHACPQDTEISEDITTSCW